MSKGFGFPKLHRVESSRGLGDTMAFGGSRLCEQREGRRRAFGFGASNAKGQLRRPNSGIFVRRPF